MFDDKRFIKVRLTDSQQEKENLNFENQQVSEQLQRNQSDSSLRHQSNLLGAFFDQQVAL